jgi:hypothetical protein
LIKDLINFCWFIFKWGIVPGTIAALVLIPLLCRRVDEEIRSGVERRLADHYRDFDVSVRWAVRVEGQGIEVRDLAIRPRGAGNSADPVLRVERLFLYCNTDLADLVGNDLCVSHIDVQRPTIRAVRLPDGSWTVGRLWPLPKFSENPPSVTIDNGAIEIVDSAKNPPGTMTLRDLNLSIETAPPAGGPSAKPIRTLRGTMTGDHLERIEFAGQMGPEQDDWQLTGTIHALDVSPELRAALPTPLAEPLAALTGFRGRAAVNFRLLGDPGATHGCRFELAAAVAEGRLDDPRLPYPWTNIRFTLRGDNAGLLVENLFAQGGRSTLWVSQARAGLGPQTPWTLKGKVTQLVLDERTRAALPDTARVLWDKYSPEGQVDVEVNLTSDGKQIDWPRSRITVDCAAGAFTYYKFPDRLQNAQGRLDINRNVLSVDMTADSGSGPVQLTGRVDQPLVAPHGWFEVSGKNISFDVSDQKLLAALNEKSRTIVQNLAPRGRCDFNFKVWRDQPDGPLLHRFVLDVKQGSLCFNRFPFPLEKVHGVIERLPDGTWEFRDFVGVNDTALITCGGRLTDSPQGKQLSLTLRGKNISLTDKDLSDALSQSRPAIGKAWENFEPRGMADMETQVQWFVDSKKLVLAVVAWPQSQTASIRPRPFPYQMDQLHGTVVYRDGKVTIDNFRANHGPTIISSSGQSCLTFSPDGSSHLHLENVSVDGLRLDDRDLVQALPGRLREGLAKLNPTGPAYLRESKLDIRHSGVPGQPAQIDWNARLGFHQGRVECGIALENMNGELTLAGGCDGRTFHSQGELAIDSLIYRKFQFTKVTGPFWIDDDGALFGSWVARRQRNPDGSPTAPPRALSAKLFGGDVKADAWVAPRFSPCYGLHAELLGADLARFAMETLPGAQELRGRVGVELDLYGHNRAITGLRGGGRVWLREGDVYKLPVMIAILKLLSGIEPTATAFSEANVQFQINGERVYLKPIEFNGDAVSLVGMGEMDFRSNVDLAFHAVVGRNKWKVPLFSPLMGEVSGQMLTIKVRGPLQNPDASRDVLPGVKEALRELEASLQTAPAAAANPPTTSTR